jgi:hypothetical protein
MAKLEKTGYELEKGEAPTSLDEALLDEFFSIVASVAVRLTKDDIRANNCDESTKQEADEK